MGTELNYNHNFKKTRVMWNILSGNKAIGYQEYLKNATLRGIRRIITNLKMNKEFVSVIPHHITDYERLGRYSNINNLTEHDMILIAREQSKYIEAKYVLEEK